MSRSGAPVGPSALISGFSAATAASVLAGSRSRSRTRFWSGCGFQRLVEDLRAGRSAWRTPSSQAVQPLLDHRLHVDLEQQVAAAAQVEAEMHGAPGQPGGRRGKQVGQAEQHPEQADAEDERWSSGG